MKTKTYLILLFAISALMVGCSKIQVSDMKSAVVGATVFGDGGTGSGVGGDGSGCGEEGCSTSLPSTSGNPSTTLMCSRKGGAQIGYALDTAASLEIQIVDQSGNIICKDDSSNIKSSILNHIFPLKICAAATGSSYKVRLLDPSQKDLGKDLLNFRSYSASLKMGSSGNLVASPSKWTVLYDNRSSGDLSSCDQTASPLIIKTVSDDRAGFQLTSVINGILFDILGERAQPYAHAKQQISWIKKASYMFLVLPDEHGEVNGIDQMFGNDTKGPDGDFADNGYEALAKYDLNHDGVIDQNDAIYSKLRLWSDANLDGVAQSSELISLEEAGIVSIDLHYDNNYYERDKYGNETKMKSVVQLADGSMRLIFDLWFAYQAPFQKK